MWRVMSLVLCLWAAVACSDTSTHLVAPGAVIGAVERGDIASVKRALDAGESVDELGDGGRTPLIVAVDSGHTDIALLLMARGADINIQADDLDTPWLLAGAMGRAEILEAMLVLQPDLSIRNRFGGNALIPACERRHVEAVKVLLRSKIDVDHVNDLGWTCLLEVVILGDGGPRHQEVAQLVLAAGADPNIADRDGVTPTQHARQRSQRDIERLLLDAGGR